MNSTLSVVPVKTHNILLTGYRATGKSTIGRQVAKQLDYAFIDTDTLIAQAYGASVAKIIEQEGWARFREMEEQCLRDIMDVSATVIATGGGAIEHTSLWPQVRKGCFSIWLQAETESILERIRKDQDRASSQVERPALTAKGVEEEIAEVLARRRPLYAAGSDFALNTEKQGPDQLARRIVEEYRARYS